MINNYLLEVQSSTVSLPIRKGDFKLAASYSDAHGTEQLKHSVDFLCKVGTEVLAVLPGTVTDVVDHFKEYGDKLKFAQKVNYITIQHEDNLFSQYLHLGNKQTKVKVGMNVKQGQVIGTTGLSGYMTKPHLHFHMCIMTDDDKVWKTVPFNFKPYIDIVRESYIFSDRTISVNLHEFENGNKNKLIIIGVPGSGKTSLAKYLLEKYNVNDFVSDDHWTKMLEGLKSSKRTIIEGAGLAILYMKDDSWKKLIIEQPMILMGMSAIKAGLRADRRDGTLPGKAKDWKDTFYFVRNNFTYFEKAVSLLRKDVMKIPDAKIEEYKVPKFKTVLN